MTCACSCVVISFYHWFLRHAIFQIYIIVTVKYMFIFFYIHVHLFVLKSLKYFQLSTNTLLLYRIRLYISLYMFFRRKKNTCCSNKSICYQSRVSVLRNIEQNRFVFVCKQVFIWKKFGFFFNSKCFVFN